MDRELEFFRDMWAESVALNARARERFGEEQFSRTPEAVNGELARRSGKPYPDGIIPDESSAMFARVKEIRGECKDIAGDYFEARPNDFKRFEGLNREHLVNLISIARHRDDAEEALLIDMWLIAHFEPQIIRGNFRMPAPGTGRRG